MNTPIAPDAQPPLASLPVPDYMEPLVAWRVWSVRGEKLESSLVRTVWLPYRMMEAHHENYMIGSTKCVSPPCEIIPLFTPGCGIYGWKTAELLKHSGNSRPIPRIIGEVYLWGRVYEHEHGYRAQYAYPKRFIYGHKCDARMLATTYGIPFEEDDTWKSVFQFVESSLNPWFFRSPSPFFCLSHRQPSNPVFGLSSPILNLSPWPSQSILPPDRLKLIHKPCKHTVVTSNTASKYGRLYRPRHWFEQNGIYRRVNVNQWLEAKS